MERIPSSIEVLIAGSPNTGKTTIFNRLTGFTSRVSNYAGVTVETKSAKAVFDGTPVTITDLPGTYSLSASSDEEILTRKTILAKTNAVIICVVDATQLERNLFLTSQFLELGLNVILVLNKMDRLKKANIHINTDDLSRELSVPVVAVNARNGDGIAELRKTIACNIRNTGTQLRVDYGKSVNNALDSIETCLVNALQPTEQAKPTLRMMSLGYLVVDTDITGIKKDDVPVAGIAEIVEKARNEVGLHSREDLQNFLDERRYNYIDGFIDRIREKTGSGRISLSDRLDNWIMSPVIGIPIFLAIMWLLFTVVFVAAKPLSSYLEGILTAISHSLVGRLGSGPLESLVLDGIIGGVGAVLIFVPSIFLLFVGIALLEDTGYLSRAAFIMERTMSRFGLPGKAFMPIMLGFGCNVPAIMATRILEDKRDRTIAILVIPFISCSARLPVYILIAGALCPPNVAGTAVFFVYLLSISMTLTASGILRKLMFKGSASPMILEIPPYSLPTFKAVAMHAWRNSLSYIQKAFTFILAGSVVLWAALNYPVTVTGDEVDRRFRVLTTEYESRYESLPAYIQTVKNVQLEEAVEKLRASMIRENVEDSIAGRIGKALEPVLAPLGFDWRIGVGLLGGVLAKEIVNSTLGVIFSSGADSDDGTLIDSIRNSKKPDGTPLYTPLTAISLMVFVLLYIPCVATLAVQKKELGNNTKAFVIAATYTTVVAYLMSFIVYQGGKLLGFH